MGKSSSKPDSQRLTVTKADIAGAVHREIGLSKAESAALVTRCIEHISDTLKSGSDVKLANFGTFKLIHKKPRYGRNPRTGEPALVSERTVVTFKASPHVLGRVNSESKRYD